MPRSNSSISSLRTGRPLTGGNGVRERNGSWRGSGVRFTGGSPFVRIDDEAGQGLRIEVGRLLRHHVAIAGDRLDRGDGSSLEQEGGIDPIAGLDRRDGLG